MRLNKIKIENFRAHSDTELPLSQFACLIGENNAGKSTVLHALQFALEGNKLQPHDFRDPAHAIRVTVWIDSVDDTDLARILNSEHRTRVQSIIRDGSLVLVRTMPVDGSSDLEYMQLAPKNDRWSLDKLNESMKGQTGATLRAHAVSVLPELDLVLEEKPTMGKIREARENLIRSLPEEDLVLVPTKLPTGIPSAVKPLLPEVIYIEAVKDATTETKTTDSAAFGKLLKLLLTEVSSEFDDITKQFALIQKKLSRVTDDGGTLIDDRLKPVQLVESTIERFVQESFPGVRLKMNVPAPALTTILGASHLSIDDGHEGPLANKGDGLKRTVLFAILRAYTRLRAQGMTSESAAAAPASSYFLLFEEPELYLHPRAQRQLMSTLEQFAVEHPVLVTTHSSGFFGGSTTGFAKLQKHEEGVEVSPVELNLEGRDAYQLIQHENNEAGFFARSIVLVEGDSDTFTFPYLAKLINPDWNDKELNIRFIKTGGKGSIARYKNFFEAFKVKVHVIADLDALVDGFQHLTQSNHLISDHAKLLSEVSEVAESAGTPNSKKVRNIVEKRNAGELWKQAQEDFALWSESPSTGGAEKIQAALAELFDLGRGSLKLAVLKDRQSSLVSKSDKLLDQLMLEDVYVLRHGDLEAYCGSMPKKSDKVSGAMEFCSGITSLEQLKECHNGNAEVIIEDLRKMFSRIYSSNTSNN